MKFSPSLFYSAIFVPLSFVARFRSLVSTRLGLISGFSHGELLAAKTGLISPHSTMLD